MGSALSHNRNTVDTKIILSEHHCKTLENNKNTRVMLYCGAVEAPALGPMSTIHIAFPQQVEVKVNKEAIPGSQLKGLKNKPGSTRPPDITHLLVKTPGHCNEVSLTYAETNKARK